ncbi:hypothetical protein J9332_31290, partial [Aquimarina celericrescens]|nr:hypothetical protein [Aquimarina celericrescens]
TVAIALADIAAETDTNTTNASLTEDGTNLILTDSDGSTVAIALADIDTNTTNASFTEDGTNLIITDSDGSTVAIALADIDTNTTNASFTEDGTNLIITDSDGSTVAIALADIDTNTTNVSLVVTDSDSDGAGDTLTLTDSDGSTLTADISIANTDDQFDVEVPIFPTEDTNADTVIDETDAVTQDLDGDGTPETDVGTALNSIERITSKAARIFYPPSIEIDASSTGNNRTVDLYQEYIDQFGSPTAASNGAPAALPTYARDELYYYVTFADPAVFGPPTNITIGGTGDGANEGVMTYDIIATPADFNTLINVVFMVK